VCLRYYRTRLSCGYLKVNCTLHRLHRYELGFVLPFFLVVYRPTPHSATGYSPFYLLLGRGMVLPNEDDLKAEVSPNIQDADQVQRLENLKST